MKLGCCGFVCSLQAAICTQPKIVYEVNEALLHNGKRFVVSSTPTEWPSLELITSRQFQKVHSFS